jgi:hypothetical protein
MGKPLIARFDSGARKRQFVAGYCPAQSAVADPLPPFNPLHGYGRLQKCSGHPGGVTAGKSSTRSAIPRSLF